MSSRRPDRPRRGDARPSRRFITDCKPTGTLRFLLRLPIWLYRARLGFPAQIDDPARQQVAARVHAVAFRPGRSALVIGAATGKG